MLHVKPCLSNECEELFAVAFPTSPLPAGIDVGLYLDEVLIGGARVSFGEDKARLEAVYLKEEYRKNGFGDFLTRAVMDAYTRSLPVFEIAYADRYFEKFGFSEQNGIMTVKSDAIRFPSLCGGNH